MKSSVAEILTANTDRSGTCWEWTGRSRPPRSRRLSQQLTKEYPMTEHIPQTAGWVGIVAGHLTLIRTYADDSLTAAVRDDWGWGPEIEFTREPVEVCS